MFKPSLKLASSFRNKMILIFFAITIVPFILFSAYAYMKSVEGIQQANTTFSMSYLEQAKLNVEAYLGQLNDQINDLIGDKMLQQLLDKPPQNAQEEEAFAVNMLNLVYQKKKQMDALQLHIYPLKPLLYPTYIRTMGESPAISKEAWFRNAKNSVVPTWHLSLNQGPGVSPVLMNVKTFTGLHDRIPRGLVVTDLADNHLSRFFSPTKRMEGQKFLIVNEEGQIMFDSSSNEWTGDQLPSRKLLDMRSANAEGTVTLSIYGRKNLIAFVRMDSLPWTIISLTPMKVLTEPVSEMNRLLIFFLSVYLVCSVGVVIYITSNFTQPIFRLVRLMRKLEEGDFELVIPHQTRKDEIGWLYRGFSSVVRKIEDLIEQSTRAERNKKELEFQVLSHQINPHFLYNTLDSIRWKAENHGRNDIGEMVSALGNLLRLSLNQGKDITTVGREIEQVKAYVQIEQARIGTPLRVLYFFDEEMLEMPFMRLLLQPLVENAIQHSIRGNFEKGKVILSGHMEERDIIIEISDNGKGIPQAVLQQLEMEDTDQMVGRRTGVGLRNVNERLKIYFGSEYKLCINTEEGKGTKITIRHPILPDKGESVS
ncbi:MAG: sensor histidine kinase [Gorillibacterium sp.]|nr:sensor histidine kinase [Gorillibacterium sp.]